MNNKQITFNFLLAPANISGALTNKIDSNVIDPIEYFLYNIFNSLFVMTFIYILFERFYDASTGFLSLGVYLIMTFLLGIIVGTVNQIDLLN